MLNHPLYHPVTFFTITLIKFTLSIDEVGTVPLNPRHTDNIDEISVVEYRKG